MIVIEVSVGVILNDEKTHVYVTKRKKNQHLAGLWEFPGGKIEAGETAFDAIKRELLQEVDIIVKKATYLDSFVFKYPDKKVDLHFYVIDKYLNTPQPQEGQEMMCIEISKLKALAMPEANTYVIDQLLAQDHSQV